MTPTISSETVQKIATNQIADLFNFLGPHQVELAGKQRWVIRTFVPDATQIELILTGDKSPLLMKNVHHPHFFEVLLPEDMEIDMYQFEVTYQSGMTQLIHDPYFFDSVISDYDLYLFGKADHHKIYEKLGAHPMKQKGVAGVNFAVWAPNARNVSVIGDFNGWHGSRHQMLVHGNSGVWELFIPGIQAGAVYKYEIKNQAGHILEKSDPYAFASEMRPKTASIVADLNTYQWQDSEWMEKRRNTNPLEKPIAVYEIHLGSWRRKPDENDRFLTYREFAAELVAYIRELGYTHIELLPIEEHPLDASWGYQVTGYYAATSRFGTPEDLMYFIDYCHQNEIGVILDWVPAHFPRDAHGLALFDGSHLYEHADPRQGEHLDWGTKIFNYGRQEVHNFLLGNGLFWLDKFHFDGLRVDAVASMLYLDYSREDGEWIPNQYGGRENIDALNFIKHFNQVVFHYYPGILSIAEESTAWPGVTQPVYLGGLGFNLKWNMGWMNDFLTYFSKDPIHRKYHHNMITFALLYAFNENFMLVLSHDEVVHGKKSLLGKMPGDDWQKFANLRALLGFMYGHPGKKLLFMGTEFGQWDEWSEDKSLDWHLLDFDRHKALQRYMTDLNALYKNEPALWEVDFDNSGFHWIDFLDSENSVISFMRKGKEPKDCLVFICNFTPVYHENYRIGVDRKAFFREVLNSDAEYYWGSNKGNMGGKWSDDVHWHGFDYSLNLTLPPLATIILKPDFE